MKNNQTVAEFLKPHIEAWLQAETNYTNVRCQIVRAKAEIECQMLLNDEAKAAKKRKVLKRLERKQERLNKKTHWTDAILKPIAEYMVEYFNAFDFQIMGPFGLSCETSIWIWLTQDEAERRDLKKLYSSTFVSFYEYDDVKPIHNVIGINLSTKDYSENTKSFPEGSIGALNGGNFKNVDIMEWPMEKLVEKFRKQKNED